MVGHISWREGLDFVFCNEIEGQYMAEVSIGPIPESPVSHLIDMSFSTRGGVELSSPADKSKDTCLFISTELCLKLEALSVQSIDPTSQAPACPRRSRGARQRS